MAYADIADMTQDAALIGRLNACVAVEGERDPYAWTSAHIWELCASPGWGDAYGSALAGSVKNPGRDAAVISDAQILSAVQAIRSKS